MIKDLILKKHFIDFKEAWQIKEKDEAKVFEMFVNYIILSQDEIDTFIGHPEILEICSTGGGDDAKLDGVGIKINGRLIGTLDDIEEVIAANKKIEVEFFVIQAKERAGFASESINTFGVGVRSFFSEDGGLPENDKVKELRKLKDYILSDDKVLRKLNRAPSLHCYYVFCGKTPNDEHTEAIKKYFVKDIEKSFTYLDGVTFNIVDGKQLIEKCKELENDFKVELNIRDIIPLTVNENTLIKKAYAFTCEAKELLKILSKEDASLRRSLFNSNVRDYLGNTGGVNSEIEGTIKEDPEMFLMCNNGVTIVCSDFLQVKDKLVSIENPQIVNGCQTCTTIYLQKDIPSLNKVQVLIKLICTEDTTITNKVVRGTNKQNQVLEESFETTKPFHQEIEDYFTAKTEPVQLFYERRNKQYSANPNINRYQIVNLRVLTQSFVATFLQSPYLAHRHEAKLLQEFAKTENQRKIYLQGQSLYAYYISSLIWFKFEDAFRRKILTKDNRTYQAHLYYIVMFLPGIYPLMIDASVNALEKYCQKLEKLLMSEDFDDSLLKVTKVFKQCEKQWSSMGKSRSGMKDTKEFTEELTRLCRDIFLNKIQNIEYEPQQIAEKWFNGKVLSYINKDKWYAFIKSKDFENNVYFDNKSYKGEIRKLIPGQKCRFTISTDNAKSEDAVCALKVEIL